MTPQARALLMLSLAWIAVGVGGALVVVALVVLFGGWVAVLVGGAALVAAGLFMVPT